MNMDKIDTSVYTRFPRIRPQSRMYCGHCTKLKPKELRKLDSCPVCGKSLYAYNRRKPYGNGR